MKHRDDCQCMQCFRANAIAGVQVVVRAHGLTAGQIGLTPDVDVALAGSARRLLAKQIALCESPAEVAMLGGLVAAGANAVDEPKAATDFVPQFHIRRFRVDFAFPIARVAVEVDGFTYHDATPVQAERDKSRDRSLKLDDWTILRFAAREVFRDAEACGREVLEHTMLRAG